MKQSMMNMKSDTENIPSSPLYLEKTFREDNEQKEPTITNARKIAISGNMYHKWQSLNLSQFEDEATVQPKITEAEPQQSEKKSEAPDPSLWINTELVKDWAAIDIVVDKLTTSPQILKQRVNWVDDWNEPIDKKSDAEIPGPERETGHELYERVFPEKDHTNDNAFKNMKDSNFLSWLKSKEAKRQGISQEEKPIEKSEKKEKKKKTKKQKETASSKEKVSKKKKKKELRKILNKSLEMEDEIVSETLANIMAQQGHIERAREMYEKLSLIFPEKSSYFADIIGKLEEE